MSAVDLLFWIFSVLSVGGGFCMVCSKHPVSAAMFMIISLIGAAALFVLLDSFFLAVLQVLVYAGAVMVLFLFIIMLLDVGPDASKIKFLNWKATVLGAVSCFFLVLVFLVAGRSFDSTSHLLPIWPNLDTSIISNNSILPFSTEIPAFGYGLMTKYMLPVQVSGFLLLAAMVGVITLSKKIPSKR
jgi:NADH-quinone oxidoreductase subunit J